MRITDSDNCKDVINKDINKKADKIADIWKGMFNALLTIAPDDYRSMFDIDSMLDYVNETDENE